VPSIFWIIPPPKNYYGVYIVSLDSHPNIIEIVTVSFHPFLYIQPNTHLDIKVVALRLFSTHKIHTKSKHIGSSTTVEETKEEQDRIYTTNILVN
jgi:hypothetical protein